MKLFTLGCSLTHHYGMKEKVASMLNAELINFAESAGSNQLQINKIQNYIINNSVTHNDIILWQITGSCRSHNRLFPNNENRALVDKVQKEQFSDLYGHWVRSPANIFDGVSRLDLLSNSPLLHTMTFTKTCDENQNLETLLANIILLSAKCKNLLVMYGWESIFFTEKNKNIFYEKLLRHNIPVLTESYLDWVIQQNLPLLDDSHPTMESGEIFAEKVIVPKLKELGWLSE
jgi:hypothetical protein